MLSVSYYRNIGMGYLFKSKKASTEINARHDLWIGLWDGMKIKSQHFQRIKTLRRILCFFSGGGLVGVGDDLGGAVRRTSSAERVR